MKKYLFMIIVFLLTCCKIYYEPVKTISTQTLDSIKNAAYKKIKINYVGKPIDRFVSKNLISFDIENDTLYGIKGRVKKTIIIPVDNIKHQLLVGRKNMKGVKMITATNTSYIFTDVEVKNDTLYGTYHKIIEIPVNKIYSYQLLNQKASTITTIVVIFIGVSAIVFLSLTFTLGMSGFYGP